MQLEGKIIPFGDLIHLTAAASCNQNPTIGSLVCDPWGRPLNQNIIVIRLIKTLHLTNITILGILTYLFFAVIVLAYIKRIECIGLSVPIFMFSPPLILAVDRGNEIVTLLLILSGLLLIVRESICFSSLGALLLSFSAIFKLWPVVLILSLIIYSNRNLKAHIKVLLGMSIVYWLINLDMVRAILRATQHGSPFGNSFGLKLFWNPELNSLQTALLLVLAVLLIGLFWVVNETNFDQFRIEITNAQYGFFLVPNFFTYFTIWAVGDSFSYRVIVLLPAVLILSQKKLNQSKTA
jgi:hypothetical protein